MKTHKISCEAQDRLDGFLDQIGTILGNERQRASFAIYAAGLLGDSERKSVEPIAALACPDPMRVNAVHHQLIHFLASSPWQDTPVRQFASDYAVEAMQVHDPIRTWIVDDTGFLKQGEHSPGVQRQYTGSAGKTANCQIGVSLVVATTYAHLPVDFRLYVPQSWAEDPKRCARAHIPVDVGYVPKWRLGLDMIEASFQAGRPRGVVLADTDYGNKSPFRDGLDALGLPYAVEVQGSTKVQRVYSDGRLGPAQSVAKLARRLKLKLRKVTWREGTQKTMHSRFARVRVVVARDEGIGRLEEWLMVEWPQGEPEPSKFVLSTMPQETSCKLMVQTVKSRWRTERAYEDLKGELGLNHFEGRSFPGWHHHVTVALCCYAFLVAEQARSFFPSATGTVGNCSLQHAA